jgi:chromatin segregation and condensation protein Rec8/ScpA/Scc1 (kleisin family)
MLSNLQNTKIKKQHFLKQKIQADRIRTYFSVRKEIKAHRYKIFLQNPRNKKGKSIELPTYEHLKHRRKQHFILGMICLMIISCQTIFFYETTSLFPIEKNQYQPSLTDIIHAFTEEMPVIIGFLAIMFLSFAGMYDFVIYRRWGLKKSIIDWGIQK